MDGRMHRALSAFHFTETLLHARAVALRLAAACATVARRSGALASCRGRCSPEARPPVSISSLSRGAIRRGISGAGASQGAPCPNEPRSDSAGRPRLAPPQRPEWELARSERSEREYGPWRPERAGACRAESAADRSAAEGAATRRAMQSIPEARAAAHPTGGDGNEVDGAAGRRGRERRSTDFLVSLCRW